MAETNIQKLLRALIAPFQELEDCIQTLMTERAIDTAVGAQLDQIGKVVGRPRNGVTDDELYRRYCRAQVVTNRSKGTIAEMIKIADLVVYEDDATYVVDNQGAAAYVLRVEDVAVSDDVAEILISFLRDATAAGVRAIAETCTADAAAGLFMDGAATTDSELMFDARE